MYFLFLATNRKFYILFYHTNIYFMNIPYSTSIGRGTPVQFTSKLLEMD